MDVRAQAQQVLPVLGGSPMWRSLDEYAQTPEFRTWIEREFQSGASVLDGETRRDVLKVMGASLALAGAIALPGCRRPDHKILPYSSDVPEETIPGRALYFATSMPTPSGGAEGLIVETHEGRPTKVDGNPLHPVNRGKSSLWAQASVLEMYDPDRLTGVSYLNPARGRVDATWEDFDTWAHDHFATFDAVGGRGLAFIVDKTDSPSREHMREKVMARWPEAEWVPYCAVETHAAAEGSRIALRTPTREIFNFQNAKVVVSLDRDFIENEAGALVSARELAASRRVDSSHDEMSRLYVVESRFSNTGSAADHRVRLAPSRVKAFAVALARAVLTKTGAHPEILAALDGVKDPGSFDLDVNEDFKGRGGTFIQALVDDLTSADHLGHSLVMAGDALPAEVHSLVHAINSALHNVGSTVSYLPMGAGQYADSANGIANLADKLNLGRIDTVVCVHVNPVYNAPADSEFARAFMRAPNRIVLSVDPTETQAVATWSLNGTHYLEQWGDVRSFEGTISPIQPMIAPLYHGRSDIELLASLLGETPDGHEIVRTAWTAALGWGENFERNWRRALHDGVVANSAKAPGNLNLNVQGVADAARTITLTAGPTTDAMDVVFHAGKMYDGRFANNAWLHELPETATRVAWGGPACVSPATAEKLGLEPEGDSENVYINKMPKGEHVTITIDGRSITMPLWVMPGLSDDTIVLPLGYGRTACGGTGNGIGQNTFEVRARGSLGAASGATIARAPGRELVASTQNHWSMENRTSIVRQIDFAWWKKHAADFEAKHAGREEKIDSMYRYMGELNLAEAMGELAHTPPNKSIYENPLNKSRDEAAPGSIYSKGPQWGMTIDLTTCTGCGTCTIACQSENNIPVVGKHEVAKGRELAWIRVDRYFTGDLNNPTQMLHQPVACVQCENAPCETVCPVTATTHGNEGINHMVYNRCIGTRYCANNCPYKVRRFNFFDYGQVRLAGGLNQETKNITGDMLNDRLPKNINVIPPRLRERLTQLERMRQNPDVTVRGRGVMEKCTYCIQRINEAKIELKTKSGMQDFGRVPDGFVQSACQQACPSNSITFGNLLDENAQVTKLRNGQRSYMLLGFLDTRPRTSYLLQIRNRNPLLMSKAEIEHDPIHHSSGHGAEHDNRPGGHGEETETHSEEGHAFLDRSKQAGEKGYRMSLRVLGSVGSGVLA